MNKITRIGIILMAYGILGYIPMQIIAYDRVLPWASTGIPAFSFIMGSILFIVGGEK